MRELIKSAIEKGGYKLADMERRIMKLYANGDLTDVEYDDLLAMAQNGVSADAERPENLTLIHTLAERLEQLEARVKALEGGETIPPDETETPAYPAWEPWDGISSKYQKGERVTHNGVVYESTLDGQNVWEPGTVPYWVRLDELPESGEGAE